MSEKKRNSLSILKERRFVLAFEAYAFVALSANSIIAFHEGAKFGIVLFLCAVLYFIHSMTTIMEKKLPFVNLDGFDAKSAMEGVRFFGLFFAVSFAVTLFWFMGRYPGSFSYDSINQINQALSGNYSDWHPVLHTLLFFTLPLKLTNTAVSIVFFLFFLFSLLMGCFGLTILKYGGMRFAVVSLAFVLASPYVLNILMYPWKDVAFAMASAVAMIFLTHCYFSNGEWLNRYHRVVLFALMLAVSTILRHNGALFTFPLFIVLFFIVPKKKWILVGLLCVTFVGLIRGPLYSYNDVRSPGNRVTETVGLPMSVILNVAKESPESLDEETASFVFRLTDSVPEWQSNHSLMGGFNSIKFKGIKTNVIEEAGRFGVLRMALKCFVHSPSSSFFALLGMISSVYGVNMNCDVGSGVNPNDLGIEWKGLKIVDKLEKFYCIIFELTPLKFFFCSIGFPLLFLLSLIVFKLDLKTINDRRKILLSGPIFCYTIGTSFFWFGMDSRFFFATYLCSPLVAAAFLSPKANTHG